MEKAAGLTSTVVYVSYETLEAYGTSNGINHYEIVMPNPVDEFAYGKVKMCIRDSLLPGHYQGEDRKSQ